MDLKAFQHLYTETIDALAQRHLLDALSLTEAILKDTMFQNAIHETTELRQQYAELLRSMPTMPREEREEQVAECFRNAIEIVEMSRHFWNLTHPSTPHARLTKELQTFDEDHVLDQLYRIRQSQLGQEAYHTALDAAFGLLWHINVEPYATVSLKMALSDTDGFARRTLVGALLLGLLDEFSTRKIHLLLALADKPLHDKQEDADLQARIAVALAIVYERYDTYFLFYTDEAQQLRAFFERHEMREQLPSLLHAVTSQSQAKRIGNKVDDILPIIRKAFEKHQPHLGDSDDENTEHQKTHPDKETKKDSPFSVEFQELKLDSANDQRLFHQLANHARKVDEMRQADLDINLSSFTHMKRFDFFSHPAHWFYPFSTQEPSIQQALMRPNGKTDRMTLSIMKHNRFCASDCYSYASMMGYLRHEKKNNFIEMMNEQIDEIEEAYNDFEDAADEQEALNPYADFCQSLHRYFVQNNLKDLYYHPFTSEEKSLLPEHPLFQGLFNEEDAITPSIDTLIYLGAYEQAIILINFSIEHFGASSALLYAQGNALMQLQQWKQALAAFQQLLIIDDNPEAELCMARCFEALSQWGQALPLLQNEEQRLGDENNATAADIIEETGRCLIQLQRWDEAVQRFFRLEFMEQHLNVARRAIAWCSIHQGKYERAANYYRQLLQLKKATWEDHLNLGHTLWLKGELQEAVSAYHQSLCAFNKSKKAKRQHYRHWSEAFQDDARTLLAAHFDTAECALMHDAVMLAADKANA